MSILNAPFFQDEPTAYAKLESIVWPNGPVCPHCGATDRVSPIHGKSARIGLKFCGHCRKQFTVKVGTIFESSHVSLNKWLQAVFLLASSKKGFSAHQLHRVLGVTYKTAWFMAHRIREAMKENNIGPMGGDGSTIEADETYLGGRKRGLNKLGRKHGIHDKMKVVGLVERGGKVRSFNVEKVDKKTIHAIVLDNVSKESSLMTDEAFHYRNVGKKFARHGRIEHNEKIYVRGDVHTNTIEGFFGLFKRGMKGVYQHCSEKHLHRYLAEFDFRYNNREALEVSDAERAERTLRGIVGKRLAYRVVDR